MTTSYRNYPTRIKTKHNNKTGRIVLDQIGTIDKQQIIKELGQLTGLEIKKLNRFYRKLTLSENCNCQLFLFFLRTEIETVNFFTVRV